MKLSIVLNLWIKFSLESEIYQNCFEEKVSICVFPLSFLANARRLWPGIPFFLWHSADERDFFHWWFSCFQVWNEWDRAAAHHSIFFLMVKTSFQKFPNFLFQQFHLQPSSIGNSENLRFVCFEQNCFKKLWSQVILCNEVWLQENIHIDQLRIIHSNFVFSKRVVAQDPVWVLHCCEASSESTENQLHIRPHSPGFWTSQANSRWVPCRVMISIK